MLGLGTFTAVMAFDFEPLVGFFHYALFFGVTVLLRATMGLALLPGVGGEAAPPPPQKVPPKAPQFMWQMPDERNRKNWLALSDACLCEYSDSIASGSVMA